MEPVNPNYTEYIFEHIPQTQFGYGKYLEASVLIDSCTNYINASKLDTSRKYAKFVNTKDVCGKLDIYTDIMHKEILKNIEMHNSATDLVFKHIAIDNNIYNIINTPRFGKLLCNPKNDNKPVITFIIERSTLKYQSLTTDTINNVIGTYIHPIFAMDFLRYINYEFYIQCNYILSRQIHKENLIIYSKTINTLNADDCSIEDIVKSLKSEISEHDTEISEFLHAGMELDIENYKISKKIEQSELNFETIVESINLAINKLEQRLNEVHKMYKIKLIPNVVTPNTNNLLCRHGSVLTKPECNKMEKSAQKHIYNTIIVINTYLKRMYYIYNLKLNACIEKINAERDSFKTIHELQSKCIKCCSKFAELLKHVESL